MNLLEVKSISKTYGEGDTTVQATERRICRNRRGIRLRKEYAP